MSNNKNADFAVLTEAARILSSKKMSYVKILAVTFVVACLIILPQPRYYTCEEWLFGACLKTHICQYDNYNAPSNIFVHFNVN